MSSPGGWAGLITAKVVHLFRPAVPSDTSDESQARTAPVKDMREGRVYLKDFVTISWTHIVAGDLD